jgi:hypothetical protein
MWLEDAASDLQELRVKRWRQMADNRDESAYVVKDDCGAKE